MRFSRRMNLVAVMLGISGPVVLAGDMTVEGNVEATTFVGSGAGLTGVVKTEVDPKVGAMHADKWCKVSADGSVIDCDQDAPPTSVTFQLWVPKTGQKECWDTVGAVRFCGDTGEDGLYKKGGRTVAPADNNDWTPSFRVSPRFTDHGDGTVTDNLTGLVWLKNANCIVDNAGFDDDGIPNDGEVAWQHGLDFVSGLNAGLYDCGDISNGGSAQTDWRLPNANELLSLVDPGETSPALSPGYPFSGVAGSYWSSTTRTTTTSEAWMVVIQYSDGVTFAAKNLGGYVWPVRGGQ